MSQWQTQTAQSLARPVEIGNRQLYRPRSKINHTPLPIWCILSSGKLLYLRSSRKAGYDRDVLQIAAPPVQRSSRPISERQMDVTESISAKYPTAATPASDQYATARDSGS